MIEREDRLANDHPVTVLRLSHGKANAIDPDLLAALDAAFAELETSDARAVVLTGRGGMFSAGLDLFQLTAGGKAYLDRLLGLFPVFFRRLFEFPKPVVAAVNGHALAGGCVLTSACDRRVMARGPAKIGVTELLVGVPFPVIALEIVRGLLPQHVAADLITTGRAVGADEALRIGLVEELAELEEVLERAVAVAGRLGAVPTDVFAITKRHLRRPILERIDRYAGLDDEIHPMWKRSETLDGIRAFLERNVGRK